MAVRSHPKQSPVSASLLYTLYTNWQGKERQPWRMSFGEPDNKGRGALKTGEL